MFLMIFKLNEVIICRHFNKGIKKLMSNILQKGKYISEGDYENK